VVITPSEWRVQPWKNGRGVTSEVIRLPDVDAYELRISVADVTESGPFSTFPGYTRWSLLLEGGPIWLAGQQLATLFELDGSQSIDARASAPARLLNILGRGIRVGRGDADQADLAFGLDDRVTHVFDVPMRVTGNVVWIKRSA